MSAFLKVREIITGATCINGHAVANQKNKIACAKMHKEVTKMFKEINGK